MRLLLSSLVAAAAVTFAVSAHADTISFVSSAATTTYGSTVTGSYAGSGKSAIQVNKPAPQYPAAQPGSAFVSTNAAGNLDVGTTYFSNSFTLLAGEAYTGSLLFTADDYASILVNGVTIYTPSTMSQYQQAYAVNLLPSYFKSGANTITFALTNTGGAGAVDFAGSVTGVAATPEPSSLMLLGTGLVGVVGAMRRRLQTA